MLDQIFRNLKERYSRLMPDLSENISVIMEKSFSVIDVCRQFIVGLPFVARFYFEIFKIIARVSIDVISHPLNSLHRFRLNLFLMWHDLGRGAFLGGPDDVSNALPLYNIASDLDALPLHYAAVSGQISVFQELFNESARRSNLPNRAIQNINQIDMAGRTPLHLAAMCGYIGIVRLLAAHGAAVDQQDNYGETPLCLAARYNYTNVVQCLANEFHADFNLANINGDTPLHRAVTEGWINVVRFLVEEKNVNINAKNNVEQTPLHLACHYNLRGFLCSGTEDLLNRISGIRTSKIPKNERDDYLELRMIKYLIAKGADVNHRDALGETPLHKSTYYLNRAFDDGNKLRVSNYRAKVMIYLVNHMANVDEENADGKTPLDLADLRGLKGMAYYLKDRISNERLATAQFVKAWSNGSAPYSVLPRELIDKITNYLPSVQHPSNNEPDLKVIDRIHEILGNMVDVNSSGIGYQNTEGADAPINVVDPNAKAAYHSPKRSKKRKALDELTSEAKRYLGMNLDNTSLPDRRCKRRVR